MTDGGPGRRRDVRQRFPSARATPPAVRRWAAPVLEELVGHAKTAEAQLVLSELVANAVLHGRGDIDVSLRPLVGGGVRMEIWDADPAGAVWVRVRSGGVDRPSGRGLLIVDRLAHRWEVEPHELGKLVWAEIAGGD